jgi:ribonucleotide monophosphatase NagD (HAD superfamily)
MDLSRRASTYDHFLVDLDGCVWIGDDLTSGGAEAVAELRQACKRVVFVTNDPRRKC